MQDSALFQILYQHETLFHVKEAAAVPAPTARIEEKAETIRPAATAQQVPVPPPAPVKASLPATPSIPAPAPGFPALQHKILILIDEGKQEQMLESESLFLDNILKAVGHSTAETDILNFSFIRGTDARKVFAEKRTSYFISFGVPLIKLSLDLLLPPYTPKQVEGIWFLLTDPLVVIESDRNLKKKLWQALQQMFQMS